MIKKYTLSKTNLLFLFMGLFSLLGAFPLPLYACDQHSIKVENAWARANIMSANGNSAVFMDITNHSEREDKLINATTDICETVELHTHKKVGNIYKMRPIEAIPLPKGKKVSLKPGGLHIMLLNLKKPLKEGDTIKVTLSFENAAKQTLAIEARKVEVKKNHKCQCNNHK